MDHAACWPRVLARLLHILRISGFPEIRMDQPADAAAAAPRLLLHLAAARSAAAPRTTTTTANMIFF